MRLFESHTVGGQVAPNRMVLPPLTRSRAGEDGLPNPLMALYYRQRSGAGLVVSEGTVVSPQGVAYPRVPGIHTPEQLDGWRPIVDGIHAGGALAYCQLWHVGRQSHSSVQPDGLPPLAPSPVAVENFQYRSLQGRIPYETPRELTVDQIHEIIGQYAAAAANARGAGFDGVELHGANGYLIDQFLNSSANRRVDHFGGSLPNRTRFLALLLEAIGDVMPLERVGVRLSPSSDWMDMRDDDKRGVYSAAIEVLNRAGVGYLHLVEPSIAGSTSAQRAHDAVESAFYARQFHDTVIVTGDHTLDSAEQLLADGVADMVGFGRLFIANPDLPERFRRGAPLNQPTTKGFYNGGVEGYVDYPTLADEERWAETALLGRDDRAALLASLATRTFDDLAATGDLHTRFMLERQSHQEEETP